MWVFNTGTNGLIFINVTLPHPTNLTGKEPDTTEGSSRQLCRPQSPITGEITLADVPGLVALSGPLPLVARVAVMLLREISIAIL